MISLSQRHGERPETHYVLPHQQLSLNAAPEIYERLKGQAWGFEFIKRHPSIGSVPGAEALWLYEDGTTGCTEVFLAGKQFALIRPPYDGSMHTRRPLDQVQEMLERG